MVVLRSTARRPGLRYVCTAACGVRRAACGVQRAARTYIRSKGVPIPYTWCLRVCRQDTHQPPFQMRIRSDHAYSVWYRGATRTWFLHGSGACMSQFLCSPPSTIHFKRGKKRQRKRKVHNARPLGVKIVGWGRR